ncbi:MAG TPA: hypothetical protein VFQ17_05575 [Nocardioides sp.]|jgi:hypothetical protein|nr:hypothetical protein [Nocardioides sp.]
MRFHLKDLFATLLIGAVAVPYIGYLLRGEMPPIEDAHGMAGTALVFGAVACLVMWRGDPWDRTGKGETALAVVSLGLGLAAFELSETAAADLLLAVFMVSLVLVWLVKVSDHTGLLPWRAASRTTR